jgi:hypothetical protein
MSCALQPASPSQHSVLGARTDPATGVDNSTSLMSGEGCPSVPGTMMMLELWPEP